MEEKKLETALANTEGLQEATTPRSIIERWISSEKKVMQVKRDRGPTGLYTGRRKTSVAIVKVISGTGKFIVNKKPLEEYFGRKYFQKVTRAPLVLLEKENSLDVIVKVKGGGLTGQSGAICNALARSLDYNFPSEHGKLKKAGYLTRDSRMVERKKYGLHKARRASQFSKR